MTSEVPVVILLAKERASSFRRRLEILRGAWKDPPSHFALQETLLLIDELVLRKGSTVSLDTPLITLEWALEWANRDPPPPVAALREARTALAAAAADWAESFLMIQEMSKRQLHLHGPYWPNWLFEVTRAVAAEKRRIDLVLEESWPVADEEREQKALAELKDGKGVELEDAFAQIAGVSKDEWLRRVAEHKGKKQGCQAG